MKNKSIINLMLDRMHDKGIKITLPRMRIIEALVSAKKPISADDIYEKVSDTINRVTVYRNLSMLEDVGCISRFTFQNKHVYEPATTHSHYLICRRCEKVERIPSCTLDDIEKASLRSSKKFASVEHHTLQLSGTCRGCV